MNIIQRDACWDVAWELLFIKDDVEMLMKLLSNCNNAANRGQYDYTMLHRACSFGRKRCVVWLLQQPNVDVNAISGTSRVPLHSAVAGGDIYCMKLLLDAGADPSIREISRNRTPLDEAKVNGYEDCVKLLLEYNNN